jgi:hypothetical protein
MAASTPGGSQGGGSGSFSAWFQEADRNARSGQDPLAAGTSSSASGTAAAADYLQGWMKSWTQADVAQQADDLEAGGLLSRSTTTESASGDDYSLSRTERFRWFVTLLSVGVFFFFLAFLFLGVVLAMPGKFAFSFTLGSLSFMSAFILLQGFSQWASEVFKWERLPFTLSYFGSIAGTLFATLYLHSYIAIVVFSVMQISALGWYFATYVPGGKHGMKVISAIVRNTCKTCCKGCRLCIGV